MCKIGAIRKMEGGGGGGNEKDTLAQAGRQAGTQRRCQCIAVGRVMSPGSAKVTLVSSSGPEREFRHFSTCILTLHAGRPRLAPSALKLSIGKLNVVDSFGLRQRSEFQERPRQHYGSTKTWLVFLARPPLTTCRRRDYVNERIRKWVTGAREREREREREGERGCSTRLIDRRRNICTEISLPQESRESYENCSAKRRLHNARANERTAPTAIHVFQR